MRAKNGLQRATQASAHKIRAVLTEEDTSSSPFLRKGSRHRARKGDMLLYSPKRLL